MKVVVTGANSAVGQATLRFGSSGGAAPHAIVAAVRSERAAEDLRARADGSAVVRVSYDDSPGLRKLLEGAGAVFHLPGILFERPDSTYEQANVASTRAVIEAAKQSHVHKIVLVSAIGADERSRNRYYRTKGEAEALVRASGLAYTILRAPLLLGPNTAGAAALRRNLAAGKAKLIGGGRNLQQPLCVDDLARAAITAATQIVASNATLDVGGPVCLSDREIVERAARLSGREVRISSIPKGLLAFGLTIRQRIAKGGTGFSRDVLEVITADTRIDPGPAVKEIGIQLTGIDEMIRASLNE